MKQLLRILAFGIGGLFAIIATTMTYEIVVFSLSNETRAVDLARREFVNVCKRNGLNTTDFESPLRVERPDGAYEFVWKNPSNGDEIRGLANYLPVGAEAWLLRGEDTRAIKDRFKTK